MCGAIRFDFPPHVFQSDSDQRLSFPRSPGRPAGRREVASAADTPPSPMPDKPTTRSTSSIVSISTYRATSDLLAIVRGTHAIAHANEDRVPRIARWLGRGGKERPRS